MQTTAILPFAVAILILAISVAFGVGFAMGRRFLSPENFGEAQVAELIQSRFTRPHVLLNNITLPAKDGTTQIDHILVADSGIFVIETKHYSGWIFGDPFQNQWTQVIYRKKSKFLNPVHQNYRHVRVLQGLFTLDEKKYFPIVVFTGDAEFKTDVGPGVLKLGALSDVLNQNRPSVFDEKTIAYIVGRIEMKRMRRSLETDEYHLNYVRRRIQKRSATPRSVPVSL